MGFQSWQDPCKASSNQQHIAIVSAVKFSSNVSVHMKLISRRTSERGQGTLSTLVFGTLTCLYIRGFSPGRVRTAACIQSQHNQLRPA
jgi:hypothetical protein